jgi:hypothetical protein
MVMEEGGKGKGGESRGHGCWVCGGEGVSATNVCLPFLDTRLLIQRQIWPDLPLFPFSHAGAQTA